MEAIINYTIGILGLILGIAGIYLTIKSNRKKEPVYSIKSNNLISGSDSKYENLRILYRNTEVENFTVSKILFFNRGSETITRKDLETAYPLRVSFQAASILDVSILQVNNRSNNIDLIWDKSGEFLYITFDYLDKNQGAVIQVAHNGLSSDNIQVTGDLRGVEKLAHVSADQLFQDMRFSAKAVVGVAIISLIACFFSYLHYRSNFWSSGSLFSLFTGALSFLIAIPSTSLLFVFAVTVFYREFMLNKVVPVGLEKFLQ